MDELVTPKGMTLVAIAIAAWVGAFSYMAHLDSRAVSACEAAGNAPAICESVR